MVKVLFVCRANQVRSPIAEACLKRWASSHCHPGKLAVASAGTWARENAPPPPAVQQAARSLGLDLSKHRSRIITSEMLKAADVVVVMESQQREALVTEFPWLKGKAYLLTELAGVKGEVPDIGPNESGEAYRAMVREICELVAQAESQWCRFAEQE